jgi:hypothetical protein
MTALERRQLRALAVCSHCGFPHPSRCCNRPEGIAARGRMLRIHERSISWLAESPISISRGGTLSGRARRRTA